LEERLNGTADVQYVWSPLGSDTLIERDRAPSGSGALSERLYVQQDANGNVTALVDTSGNVQERYVYDPFGAVTVLAPNWTTRGSSSFAWIYLHQGGRFDTATGLYNFRNRDYSPALGRWMQVDPIGFGGGDTNLYAAYGNTSTGLNDPSGDESLPSDKRGKWIEGTKGNGTFEYADTPENRASDLAGKRVRFSGGFIAIGGFPPEWYYGGDAGKASVDIPAVTGGKADNMAADQAMRERMKNPNWRRPSRYVWNHSGPPGSTRMELVKEVPHSKVHHAGPASVPRAMARVGNGVGKTANALGGLQFIISQLADAKENAPIKGMGRGYTVINRPWVFRDSIGRFVAEEEASIWPWKPRKYYKHYLNDKGEVIDRVEISKEEANRIQEEGQRRWGYMRFNWWNFEWEFVPGTEQKRLPVESPLQEIYRKGA
jgi:RHS repeat-associated protein